MDNYELALWINAIKCIIIPATSFSIETEWDMEGKNL